jgi:hypothetical protein
VCTRIHLHVYLPAIYAYTHRDSDSHAKANAYSQATRYAKATSQPGTAAGGVMKIGERSTRRPGVGVAPKRAFRTSTNFVRIERTRKVRDREQTIANAREACATHNAAENIDTTGRF